MSLVTAASHPEGCAWGGQPGTPLTVSVPRSDRARWITALTHGERQGQGPTNKGGEWSPHSHRARSPVSSPRRGGFIPCSPLPPTACPPRVTCPGKGPLPSGHIDPAAGGEHCPVPRSWGRWPTDVTRPRPAQALGPESHLVLVLGRGPASTGGKRPCVHVLGCRGPLGPHGDRATQAVGGWEALPARLQSWEPSPPQRTVLSMTPPPPPVPRPAPGGGHQGLPGQAGGRDHAAAGGRGPDPAAGGW